MEFAGGGGGGGIEYAKSREGEDELPIRSTGRCRQVRSGYMRGGVEQLGGSNELVREGVWEVHHQICVL